MQTSSYIIVLLMVNGHSLMQYNDIIKSQRCTNCAFFTYIITVHYDYSEKELKKMISGK